MAQELNIPMPPSLDLSDGYSVRVTCIDSTGAVVTGTKIGTTTITADFLNAGDTSGGGGLGFGNWFLVPGPDA